MIPFLKFSIGLPAAVTVGPAVVGNPSENAAQNEPTSATVPVGGKRANGRKAVTVPPAAGSPPESPARNESLPATDPEGTKKGAAEDASEVPAKEVPAKNEPIPAEGTESAGQAP